MALSLWFVHNNLYQGVKKVKRIILLIAFILSGCAKDNPIIVHTKVLRKKTELLGINNERVGSCSLALEANENIIIQNTHLSDGKICSVKVGDTFLFNFSEQDLVSWKIENAPFPEKSKFLREYQAAMPVYPGKRGDRSCVLQAAMKNGWFIDQIVDNQQVCKEWLSDRSVGILRVVANLDGTFTIFGFM